MRSNTQNAFEPMHVKEKLFRSTVPQIPCTFDLQTSATAEFSGASMRCSRLSSLSRASATDLSRSRFRRLLANTQIAFSFVECDGTRIHRFHPNHLQLACGRPPQVPDCRCALVQEGFNRFSQASQVSRWVPEDVPTSSQHVWCCASMSNASRSRTRRKKKKIN